MVANKPPILAQSDLGAGKSGATDGPKAIIDELAGLGKEIHHYQIAETVLKTTHIENNYSLYLRQILNNMLTLNNFVEKLSKTNKIPIILSGDHSNAIGGLSGIKMHIQTKELALYGLMLMLIYILPIPIQVEIYMECPWLF